MTGSLIFVSAPLTIQGVIEDGLFARPICCWPFSLHRSASRLWMPWVSRITPIFLHRIPANFPELSDYLKGLYSNNLSFRYNLVRE